MRPFREVAVAQLGPAEREAAHGVGKASRAGEGTVDELQAASQEVGDAAF